MIIPKLEVVGGLIGCPERRNHLSICNIDCFNCPYEDCINDEITYNEVITDKQAGVSYYSANKYRVLKRAKAYRENNLEKVKSQERACYDRHKEEYRQKKVEANRKRYWDNPEEASRKKREYYRRKKQAAAAN